jgi:hypothetical protein
MAEERANKTPKGKKLPEHVNDTIKIWKKIVAKSKK